MKFINVTKIEIRKGERGHPFKCVAIFDNKEEWVIRLPIMERLCEGIGICEDKKYPNGLGRNMFLLAHLTKVYKKYLMEHQFKPNKEEYERALKHKIISKIKIIDKTKEVKK